MKYRRMDEKGDMVFGHQSADYLQDSPECVAQAVLTRLRLLRGEWFLDITEGTPYAPAVLGMHTRPGYDFVLRERILDTQGVTELVEYESRFDGDARTLTVNARVTTAYGPAAMYEVL